MYNKSRLVVYRSCKIYVCPHSCRAHCLCWHMLVMFKQQSPCRRCPRPVINSQACRASTRLDDENLPEPPAFCQVGATELVSLLPLTSHDIPSSFPALRFGFPPTAQLDFSLLRICWEKQEVLPVLPETGILSKSMVPISFGQQRTLPISSQTSPQRGQRQCR